MWSPLSFQRLWIRPRASRGSRLIAEAWRRGSPIWSGSPSERSAFSITSARIEPARAPRSPRGETVLQDETVAPAWGLGAPAGWAERFRGEQKGGLKLAVVAFGTALTFPPVFQKPLFRPSAPALL